MTQVVCQFSQLTQQFDTKAVFSGLSSTLTNGLTGLVGRNGQGKSVLLALPRKISHPPAAASAGLCRSIGCGNCNACKV